ncbi:alpha/beta fold hydrolase [Leptolyngbya ohadii]|uniref:alpha/beta fold hydrolase n=1 Tax=Leptolyngbya ohadii TaxID=1962290 RepID=UPI000B59A588|nr:alpha/beta fold hydrolase [Leptolyngbya ohadii]
MGRVTARRRKLWVRFLLIACALVIAAGAALLWRFQQAATPIPPSAFYTPPQPLPSATPGTIIRKEPLPENLPKGAVAWRIMYLSTGMNGEPIAVTGTIVAPESPSTTPRPVIAWAHGTVGVLPQCGVSHTADPYKQTPVVDLMVQQGFVVVATDYPGLGTPGVHPYLVGNVSAHAILDSVRAARQLEVNAGDRFVVWGASQGGQAALWAGQSSAQYAPELKLVGVAAAAPAIDLAGIIQAKMNDQGGGVFIGAALYAWSHHYPTANLSQIIKPEQRTQFDRMATTCVSTPAAFLTIGKLLTPSEYLQTDLLATEPWRTIINENQPRGRIDVPLLITHGTADTLIPIELNQAEVKRRCAAGENVQFTRLPGVGHDARNESGILTVGWIEDRFATRPTGSTCGSR